MPRPDPEVQMTGLEPAGATEAMGYVHGVGWRTFPQIEEMASDDTSPYWDEPSELLKPDTGPPPAAPVADVPAPAPPATPA